MCASAEQCSLRPESDRIAASHRELSRRANRRHWLAANRQLLGCSTDLGPPTEPRSFLRHARFAQTLINAVVKVAQKRAARLELGECFGAGTRKIEIVL